MQTGGSERVESPHPTPNSRLVLQHLPLFFPVADLMSGYTDKPKRISPHKSKLHNNPKGNRPFFLTAPHRTSASLLSVIILYSTINRSIYASFCRKSAPMPHETSGLKRSVGRSLKGCNCWSIYRTFKASPSVVSCHQRSPCVGPHYSVDL